MAPRRVRVEGGAGSPETTDPQKQYDGPDAHITIIDQAAGREYDLWKVHTNTDGSLPHTGPGQVGELRFAWGGWVPLDGIGQAADELPLTDPPLDPEPKPGASQGTAARVGDLAGRLRAEEFDAAIELEKTGGRGLVHHALFLTVNCDNGQAMLPARGWPQRDEPDRTFGRPCGRIKLKEGDPPDWQFSQNNPWNVNAPPMGSRFWLRLSPEEIDQYAQRGVPAWKRVLMRTMAEYGGFMGDTGSEKAIFSLEIESGNQYSSLRDSEGKSLPDRWLKIAGDNAWPLGEGDVYRGDMRASPIDTEIWSHLEVVHPCETRRQMNRPCSLNEWSKW